jgi:MoxR-like ATPase
VVAFLQAAHRADERYSVRDGINMARYALKRLSTERAGSGDSPGVLFNI